MIQGVKVMMSGVMACCDGGNGGRTDSAGNPEQLVHGWIIATRSRDTQLHNTTQLLDTLAQLHMPMQ